MGTDGVDGNNPAAGALVDEYTAEGAERAGLTPWSISTTTTATRFFTN
jgi:glycerate 2-kinase